MLNLLYVEDDPSSREVLNLIHRLNPDLFTVTMFSDSENFEQRLTQLDPQPDMILLDIHVAPHTGFEMLDMIRRRGEYDNIPVLALTASVMNEEVQTLRNSGFHGVLSKPLNLDEFPSIIERILAGEHIWYVW